ncbi:ribbon-helix-helix domain-containing protein [Oricola sp.]|uniref:ribbon-helix-helix domain-containing protein n=1 Tax=Oricola sp. TaxID=1979950 RepID=UPI0025D92222|nr:ribbon-helix-helix domain-containing protein [Oricola sp.]MCI5075721.1 ribbon-helix-helix domain-containing protein [Oricola sp.]
MPVRKHSVTIAGHRTSFSVEDEFLSLLKWEAEADDRSLASLVAEIDENRPRDSNLSSALRLHVLGKALQGRFSEA